MNLVARYTARVVAAAAILGAAAGASAQPPAGCGDNPDRLRWFVRSGAPAGGTGTQARPFASLADVERRAPEGATVTVLAGAGEAPLDGGIRLKDRQKLLGERQDGLARPARA